VNALPPPPGWHPDPGGSGGQRWWDGTRWTEHVSAPGVAPPVPANPVRRRYEQKWWHIPLLVGLAVASTVVSIVVQFVL
jgi:hypothetical protein